MNEAAFRIRPARDEDAAACREIIGLSFPEETRRNAGALEDLENEPWYSPSHRMVGELEGRVVAHLGIRTGELWIAGFPFLAGCIGTVAVHPGLRDRGLEGRLIEEACGEIGRRGRALAVLYASASLQGACDGLGFRRGEQARPMGQVELDNVRVANQRRVRAAAEPIEIRRGTPEDAPAFEALYFQHYSRFTGGWSRTLRFWTRRLAGMAKLWTFPDAEFYLVERPGEGALGYAAVMKDEERWDVVELACVAGHETAVAATVASFCEEARSAGVRVVRVNVSSSDPVAERLAPMGFYQRELLETVFLRVTGPERAVEQAREILTLRALGAGLAARVELEAHEALSVGRGESEVTVKLGVEDLVVLLYNGSALERTMKEKRVRIRPSASARVAVVRKLFPETHAYRSPVDAY